MTLRVAKYLCYNDNLNLMAQMSTLKKQKI